MRMKKKPIFIWSLSKLPNGLKLRTMVTKIQINSHLYHERVLLNIE